MASPLRKRGAFLLFENDDRRHDSMTTTPRVIRSDFRPARWLSNRHAQTMYTSLPWAYRYRPPLVRRISTCPTGTPRQSTGSKRR